MTVKALRKYLTERFLYPKNPLHTIPTQRYNTNKRSDTMLKDFLKQKKISIYKLAGISGIPYSTLNDIVNHKVDIANIRAGIVFKLANILHISMDELYELCTNQITVFLESYSTQGIVNIKNKKYVLEFQYQDREFVDELCPVKKEATMFIESIARWQMEKMIADYEMEEMYELCIKAKR